MARPSRRKETPTDTAHPTIACPLVVALHAGHRRLELHFHCEGGEYTETDAALADVRQYAASGGRIFASHFSYVWLYTNGKGTSDDWSSTADWSKPNQTYPTSPMVGSIDTSFAKGLTFSQWLGQPAVGALFTQSPPTVQIYQPRHDITGNTVSAAAERWISDEPPGPYQRSPQDRRALYVQRTGQRCGCATMRSRGLQRLSREHRRHRHELPERMHRRPPHGARKDPRVHALRSGQLHQPGQTPASAELYGDPQVDRVQRQVRPGLRWLRQHLVRLRGLHGAGHVRRRGNRERLRRKRMHPGDLPKRRRDLRRHW